MAEKTSMASAFPAPPSNFLGREEYLTRFKSRVEHFPFFIYEGISGIGKTALIMRLARECKAVGSTKAVLLPLWPGEAMSSILTRVEARFKKVQGSTDRQGDPFGRLVELLDQQRAVLILDNLQQMKREELPALVRASKVEGARFRILAACRGEPELSAMDKAFTHMERVGALTKSDVEKIVAARKTDPEMAQLLVEDAARGGSVCHPLTLNYMLALCGKDPPSEEFLRSQSARSVNAFRALMQELGDERLAEEDRLALQQLARVGLPFSKPVARRALGAAISNLERAGMLDVIDGDVYIHHLVSSYLGNQAEIPAEATKIIAKHLQSRAGGAGEPVAVIRAGELLARAGAKSDAVDTLAEGWESVRDLGWLEQYLKTLASIQAEGTLARRVKFLSARARMRKGNPSWVREEMEELSQDSDPWTRARAHAALTFIYGSRREHDKVLGSFKALRDASPDGELILDAGVLAAQAMVRLGEIDDAEKLSRQLLAKLKGKRQYDREGELHRLLARVYAQSGRLDAAVKEANAAAKVFEQAGDLYHAATAYGFKGDLYRETGEFEEAKKAFVRFHELANQWGDRDLIQIAELADAWVSLDIGDLTHASQQIAAVEKEMSAAPSRRLKRYLAAAKALLEVGRGKHRDAASMLARVVESWDQSGQKAMADVLRAQRVRSLIACGQLDQADRIVQATLKRLDSTTSAPRFASFLRESALIRLRRKEHKMAMEELGQARKLFATGGNRREEALTLHRIAHAALEDGDLELSNARAKEALSLARKIKHTRAVALARELLGRIALERDEANDAVKLIRESQQGLRRLGDDVGVLHVSLSLLQAQVLAGDLASAIRLGPKVRDHADRLGIQEIRIRAIVLSGAALLRRNRLDAASRCFRELRSGMVSDQTTAMMWRLGEALGYYTGDMSAAMQRRNNWLEIVAGMPTAAQTATLHALKQMVLPPRERGLFKTRKGLEPMGSEEMAWIDNTEYSFFVDLLHHRIFTRGVPVEVDSPQSWAILEALILHGSLSLNAAHEIAFETPAEGKGIDRKLKGPVRELVAALKSVKGLSIPVTRNGVKLVPPKGFGYLIPKYMMVDGLTYRHCCMVQLLGRIGTAPVQVFQDRFKLTRAAARRELGDLMDIGLIEAVRDGRGQAFRLA